MKEYLGLSTYNMGKNYHLYYTNSAKEFYYSSGTGNDVLLTYTDDHGIIEATRCQLLIDESNGCLITTDVVNISKYLMVEELLK